MKLGRIWRESPNGDVPRIVAVHPEDGRVVDLASAEILRLGATGATRQAGLRVAESLFPESMAEAIGLGPRFLDAAQEADAARADDASIALDAVRWMAA